MPCGCVGEFVKTASTIPLVSCPVCWSSFLTIETCEPRLILARSVPSMLILFSFLLLFRHPFDSAFHLQGQPPGAKSLLENQVQRPSPFEVFRGCIPRILVLSEPTMYICGYASIEGAVTTSYEVQEPVSHLDVVQAREVRVGEPTEE